MPAGLGASRSSFAVYSLIGSQRLPVAIPSYAFSRVVQLDCTIVQVAERDLQNTKQNTTIAPLHSFGNRRQGVLPGSVRVQLVSSDRNKSEELDDFPIWSAQV